MYRKIPALVNSVAERAKIATTPFVKSLFGKIFLSIVLIGPVTFLPTVWAAWTDPNIDVLRTPTWLLMIFVNMSSLLSVIHHGEWRMRLVIAVWILVIFAVWLAIVVR